MLWGEKRGPEVVQQEADRRMVLATPSPALERYLIFKFYLSPYNVLGMWLLIPVAFSLKLTLLLG